MNDNEFEAPPLSWVVLPVVGGIATGVGLILGLGWLGNRLSNPDGLSTSAFSEITYPHRAVVTLKELPLA